MLGPAIFSIALFVLKSIKECCEAIHRVIHRKSKEKTTFACPFFSILTLWGKNWEDQLCHYTLLENTKLHIVFYFYHWIHEVLRGRNMTFPPLFDELFFLFYAGIFLSIYISIYIYIFCLVSRLLRSRIGKNYSVLSQEAGFEKTLLRSSQAKWFVLHCRVRL